MREPDPFTEPDGSASNEAPAPHRDRDRTPEVREATPSYAMHALARRRWLIPTDPPPV